MKRSWLAACAAMLGACTGGGSESAPAQAGPNVLFIVVDDLNDWVGALGGHAQSSTPGIDRLASQSLLFTNAHAPSALCNPSRVAVMTGVGPVTSGVYENEQELRAYLPDAVTLPQAFRAHGWRTLGAG